MLVNVLSPAFYQVMYQKWHNNDSDHDHDHDNDHDHDHDKDNDNDNDNGKNIDLKKLHLNFYWPITIYGHVPKDG